MLSFFAPIIDLVFPRTCVLCQRPGAELCYSCAGKLPHSTPACCRCGEQSLYGKTCPSCVPAAPLAGLITLAPYTDRRIGKIIRALKYSGVSRVLGPWFESRDDMLEQLHDLKFALVPIPLHTKRKNQRGFDQSVWIAQALTSKTGLPIIHALTRTRPTRDQTKLTAIERRRNVQGAFACTGQIPPLTRVLLVDDVFTTGATAEAAASALESFNSKPWVFTLARAEQKKA